MSEEINWKDMPHLRKVGRYAFFAVCAIGVNVLVFVTTRYVFESREFANGAAGVAGLVAFLALRDMSKQWDWALEQQAKARSERRAS